MRRPPPRSTRTDTLFPYTTLFRSQTNARPSSGPSPCAVSRPNDRAVFQQRLPDILIIHHIERMAGGRCLIRPHFEPSDPRRVRRYATMLERDLPTVTGDNVVAGLKGPLIADGRPGGRRYGQKWVR